MADREMVTCGNCGALVEETTPVLVTHGMLRFEDGSVNDDINGETLQVCRACRKHVERFGYFSR